MDAAQFRLVIAGRIVSLHIEGGSMTTATDKLIADNLWRDINEAPRDGTTIFARIAGIHPDYGRPFEGEIVSYNKDLGMFIDEIMADDLYEDGDDYEPLPSKREWCESLAEFRPLPDDRCANALKIAVEALREVRRVTEGSPDSLASAAWETSHDALAKIEREAKKGE